MITEQRGKPLNISVTTLVRRHPFISFTALACAFGWGIFIAAGLGFGSNPDNMPLGPLLAAAIVAGFQGRAAFRAWARKLRSWSAPPRWYAVAILVPIAVDTGIVLVNHMFGAPLPTAAQLGDWPNALAAFVIMLIAVGIGEEAGWSAFAAPLLRERAFLTRWAMLSGIRIMWHLPLMVSGLLPWTIGIVGNAAFQMVVLCVLDKTDGRWSLVAVWHATLNAAGGAYVFTMVNGADKDRLGMLLAAAYVLVAVVMLAVTRPALGSGDSRRDARPGRGAARSGSGAVLAQR
jgi:hypothetical protein